MLNPKMCKQKSLCAIHNLPSKAYAHAQTLGRWSAAPLKIKLTSAPHILVEFCFRASEPVNHHKLVG